MSTAIPMPDPSDDEMERAVAQVEKYVAGQASIAEVAVTKRVRELRAEVDEAHALLTLQADNAPLMVDTDRVRRTRKRAAEAARLHALAQNPAARAWQAARVRLSLTAVALTALVGALGWSTTGVHHTLTRTMIERDAAWWGAWAVEPMISAVLLVVVAAKAYLAAHGHTLKHRHLTAVEIGALAVTLTLNIWPYAPWQGDRFEPMQLLAHAIGPLVAIGAVTVMPIIWTAFASLDHGLLTVGPTPAGYRQNIPDGPSMTKQPTDVRTALLVKHARQLIADGRLPITPSATRLRAALQCGTDIARAVRDALRSEGTT
ncbi:hypothetical protein [Lentzea flaviverrucosa]|uniref:Uncharacterized protein n=1 Tax=Lentzea flaviverrucosa TaxID=200379 RepID=A0A1H9WS73_9PSEU|nr:hypothetical protein [Lentzea flaviverrucosa]RDI23036.1 hypothetical protein DFR72_111167 [Lentzea flaviverrucosa]SES36527.1 hypothetical protein SAMN05216195_112161 [Lentzea flaviverrucosa]